MKNVAYALLVEDNKMVQFATCLVLRDLAWQVDTVETGEQALSFCNKHKYDVIFMDIGLPDIKGHVLAEKINNKSSLNENTPIIALTAHGDEETKKLCLKAKMVDYMLKPLTDDKINAIYDKYIKHKSE